MKVIKFIVSYIPAIAIAFVLTLFIGIFVFQPYKVEGHSMEPTLQDKQRVYASKLARTFSHMPAYGDIVVIDSRINRERSFMDSVREHPLIQLISGETDEHIFYIKRVIGKSGDVIEIKNQQVYRNGTALDEPYIKEKMNPAPDQKWVVPDNSIFVLGDNRNNSSDSRELGPIPFDHIMGIEEIK
ncbi:signal peptidase I [Paenibacillus sp. J22TS3]|uniref:signal peptidase I n=1 Tax=Paenibacillus sp. J22TS3 TaxID=2807192 RepID=UPI001B0570E4|nr:signal peptidase I [Paenibacillus sp. J22TS3]GIP19941.1 signal peptidase I S [Paenibacillus sp. J22TS3]